MWQKHLLFFHHQPTNVFWLVIIVTSNSAAASRLIKKAAVIPKDDLNKFEQEDRGKECIKSENDCAINQPIKPVLQIDAASYQPLVSYEKVGMDLDVVWPIYYVSI